MNKKFSINEILDAVNSINSVSNHHKAKKPTTEKILQAVNRIYNNKNTIEANSQPNEITIEINKQPEEKTAIKSTVSKTNLKKVIKVKKNNAIKKTKTISFEKPLLLSRIIKYKPTNTKSLFLNKLHNSKIKIITMMPPGASK
jgi:hypothetical protein